jgi:hypothetical protein
MYRYRAMWRHEVPKVLQPPQGLQRLAQILAFLIACSLVAMIPLSSPPHGLEASSCHCIRALLSYCLSSCSYPRPIGRSTSRCGRPGTARNWSSRC